MHDVSINQIAYILHYNDNDNYVIISQSERYIIIIFVYFISNTTQIAAIEMTTYL